MTSLDPQPHTPPRFPLLRTATLGVGTLAALTALTGILASLTVLAWVVAAIALVTFAASFYLKARL